MAEASSAVARSQVRRLLLLVACLLGVSVVAMRSEEDNAPPPTGRSVPAVVRMSAPLRIGGAPLECQEVRLALDRVGVRVYSKDASLSHRSDRNLNFWVDVELRVDGRTVPGTVLGTPGDPFSIAAGATTITGLFGDASDRLALPFEDCAGDLGRRPRGGAGAGAHRL